MANDTAGNPVTERAPGDALGVDGYTKDEVRPEIEQFEIDLASGVILLSFTETMNASSFDITGLTLLDSAGVSTANYTLTTAVVSDANSDNVTITLTTTALNKIKASTTLCTETTTCFISAATTAATDMSGNELTSTGPTSAKHVLKDDAPANPIGAVLNLDKGLIELRYDDSMDSESLNVSAVALYSAARRARLERASAGGYFRMSNSSKVRPSRGTTVVVDVSNDDLDRLKLSPAIWSSGTVIVSISPGAILDTSSIASNGVMGLVGDPVIMDSTKPTLDCFELDMNTGVLKFAFSEVMNITSLKRELFQLLGANKTDGTNALQLLSGDSN